MSIEELTKQQIILLCLLVAFVSATTAAIVVVRLMDQSPITSSPTINRVIQRTVQQIIPGETREITQSNTVVIKEEDLVVEAIEENKNSVVVVQETVVNSAGVESTIVNGSGLFISEKYVVAESKLISGPGKYFIQSGETKIPLEFVDKDASGFSLMIVGKEVDLKTIPFTSKDISKKIHAKVGQQAIMLSAYPALSAYTGIISSFTPFSFSEKEGESRVLFSQINIGGGVKEGLEGGILITSDGDISGLVIASENDIFAIPVDYIHASVQVMIQGISAN